MTASSIEQTVLLLPKSDRAHLLNVLLESLDNPSAAEVQQLWVSESQRRALEIDQGLVKLIEGKDLDREVQSIFR
jgi:Putative addiction module component